MAVRPGEAYGGCQRERASVNEVNAVTVHKIRKPGRAANTGDGHDLFVRNLKPLEDFIKRGEHRKITAPWTPGGMVSSKCLLGKLVGSGGRGGGGGGHGVWITRTT